MTQGNGMKNAIMHVTYSKKSDSVVNTLFYCHIITSWEKVTPLQKFSQILHFKSKLPEKFQRFNATNRSMEVLMEIWKYQNAK